MPASEDSYRSALAFIQERSSASRGYISDPSSARGGPTLGLQRTRALLDALGAPDRAFPIVHVAGSKGKGSTAAYVAAIGTAAGYRCGLLTSPHLHSYRERIAIDGVSIDSSRFSAATEQVAVAIQSLESSNPELGTVTAFELLTTMGLFACANAGCDLVVVEVGLGGTFDATNVITPAVSIITRLDLEHTNVLGNTLTSIAENKAGIIKPGVPVVSDWQDLEAMQVIERTASDRGALLLTAGRDFHATGSWHGFAWFNADRSIPDLRTGMAGDHQMANASLAIAAWETLASRVFSVSEDALRRGIAAASLPGRYERLQRDGRTWILDGAHTPHAAEALAAELLSDFGAPVVAIVGLLQDKHPEPFFDALSPAIRAYILTASQSPRAIPPEELAHTVHAGDSQTFIRKDIETSLATAQTLFPDELPIVVTGSLSLVAEAREWFGLAIPD